MTHFRLGDVYAFGDARETAIELEIWLQNSTTIQHFHVEEWSEDNFLGCYSSLLLFGVGSSKSLTNFTVVVNIMGGNVGINGWYLDRHDDDIWGQFDFESMGEGLQYI